MSFSPSTKLVNKLSHRDMYKSPCRGVGSPIPNRETMSSDNGLNESPSWRNAYKKRCFDEFKKSRQKLLNRFRNFQLGDEQEKKTKFKDYLQEELEKICLLEAQSESISIDDALEMYKQIQNELLPVDIDDAQVEEILNSLEMEDKLNQESLLLASSQSQVFCPVCQKEFLVQENSMIICKNFPKNCCNFRIDCLETQLDLAKLASRLDSAVRQHQCSEVPHFQFKTRNSMNNNDLILLSQLSCMPTASCFLLMLCEACCFMQSII